MRTVSQMFTRGLILAPAFPEIVGGDVDYLATHLAVAYYAFEAELFAVTIAIEHASSRGWRQLWIEANSYVTDLLRTPRMQRRMANINLLIAYGSHYFI